MKLFSFTYKYVEPFKHQAHTMVDALKQFVGNNELFECDRPFCE